MSYASSQDIQNEFKNITFSSNTAITTSQITSFLSDADAEINARLSCRYTVPITGTNALVIVKLIEIYLVKHRVLEILKVKTGKTSEDQDSGGGKGKNYREVAMDMIADIIARKMNLTDAVAATPAEGVRSYSNDNSDSLPFSFQRGTKQW